MTLPRLDEFSQEGQSLLQSRDDSTRTHFKFERWVKEVTDWLSELAPDSGLATEWIGLGQSPLVVQNRYRSDPRTWAVYEDVVRHRLRWLSELPRRASARQSQVEIEEGSETRMWWEIIHPAVREVAQPRFEAGHFADAVEAALKELNVAVKTLSADDLNREHDGSDLMHRVFSPNDPVLELADIATESGRAIQQGYMELFAGAMTGVRNPKAHQNISIDAVRAIHFLFLASLLFHKLEETSANEVEE